MPNDAQTELQEGLQNGGQEIDTSQNEKKQEKPKQTAQERIDEIYGKWKGEERERQRLASKIEELVSKDVERDKALETMQAHNKALAETLMGVEDKFDNISKPDREVDPDGYEEWLTKKIKRDLEKGQKKNAQAPDIQQPQFQPGKTDIREVKFMGEHDDYLEVIADVKAEMQKNPNLVTQIYSTTHPYEAAYEYGLAKRRAAASKQDAINQQGFVEGDNKRQKEVSVELTNEEKHTAKMLNISEKDFAAQKSIIEKRGW